MKTYAPSSTNSFAVANPIPSVPPVTSAILSLSLLDIFFSAERRNVLTNRLWVIGIEPLPNIRDGVLVERFVKAMRYVADMRRCHCLRLTPSGRWTTYWERRISATYRTVFTRRSTRIPSRIFGSGSTPIRHQAARTIWGRRFYWEARMCGGAEEESR